MATPSKTSRAAPRPAAVLWDMDGTIVDTEPYRKLGRNDEARTAFDRAIALANTSAEAAHIRMHLDRLQRDSQPRGKEAGK